MTLESKVYKLLLNKLFVKIKVGDSFMDKVNVISSTLEQIIVIAQYGGNVEEAKKEPHPYFGNGLSSWYYSFDYVYEKFEIEIDAYLFYLSYRELIDDNEILKKVTAILQSEYDVLEDNIHQLITDSLRIKFSKKSIQPLQLKTAATQNFLLEHIKTIAMHDSLVESIAAIEVNIELSGKENKPSIEEISNELTYIYSFAEQEINAYKTALKKYKENIPFNEIISGMKKELRMEISLHT